METDMPIECGWGPGGGTSKGRRLSDSWSTDPALIPLSPDEVKKEAAYSQAIETYGSFLARSQLASAAGIPTPDHLLAKYGGARPALTAGYVQGEILCQDGHANQAGNKFCGHCSLPMSGSFVTAEREPDGPKFEVKPVADNLDELTHSALVSRCEARGINAEGTSDELRSRLRQISAQS